MEKINGGRLPKNYIRDELDYLLDRYTPEQIKEMFESTIPKFNKKGLKMPIIYGTKGHI